MLTDLEYRVWTQYLLSADDFGVMRASPAQLQADNDHLGNRPTKLLQRCLDALVTCGLVRAFGHQGKPYIFQHDWMRFQKIEYPRATNNPVPPNLTICDEGTRALFEKHPGGQRKYHKRAEDIPNDLERTSQMYPEGIPPTRAGAPAERLTAKANGIRLTAHGSSEESARETKQSDFPMDAWFGRLKASYPANRVSSGHLTVTAFVDVLLRAPDGPESAFARMLANLTNQQAGHEWRVKGMVPKLEKWLREGLWEQQHEAAPVETHGKTAGNVDALRRFVARHQETP